MKDTHSHEHVEDAHVKGALYFEQVYHRDMPIMYTSVTSQAHYMDIISAT